MSFKPPAFAPVSPEKRIRSLDYIRGASTVFVLLGNTQYHARPFYAVLSFLKPGMRIVDRAVILFFVVLGAGYYVFSAMLGVGIALQIEKAESQGKTYLFPLCKRMAALFLIGMAHALLLWPGDVLMLYGLAGFCLLLFRKCSSKGILWLAIFLYLASSLVWSFMIARTKPEAYRMAAKMQAALSDEATRNYSSNNFQKISVQRMKDLGFLATHYYPYLFPKTLAFVLFGFYLGKTKFLLIFTYFKKIRKLHLGIGLGSLFLFIFLYLSPYLHIMRKSFLETICLTMLHQISIIAVCWAGVTFFLECKPVRRMLRRPLSCLGRMTLSNYIFDSVVCTTIFYGYGFGLYGKITPTSEFLISAGIVLAQTFLSLLWLKKFAFGPLEWVARRFTYGMPLQIKRMQD